MVSFKIPIYSCAVYSAPCGYCAFFLAFYLINLHPISNLKPTRSVAVVTCEAVCRRQERKSGCFATLSSALEEGDRFGALILDALSLQYPMAICSHKERSYPFLLFYLIYRYWWIILSALHRSWNKKESKKISLEEHCQWKLLETLPSPINTQCTGVQCQYPHFLLHPLNYLIRCYKRQ